LRDIGNSPGRRDFDQFWRRSLGFAFLKELPDFREIFLGERHHRKKGMDLPG